jgi:hypothetical protein
MKSGTARSARRYSVSGNLLKQYGSGYCRRVSSSADQQAYIMSSLEKQWAASKTEVIRVNWMYMPAKVAAISKSPLTPSDCSSPRPKFYS